MGIDSIRLGGYAPADTTHSRALDRIAAALQSAVGDSVAVTVEHNILERGRSARALLEAVEAGAMTACYFSTSYLADRVPELGVLDLP